jgi:hypothetical protein
MEAAALLSWTVLIALPDFAMSMRAASSARSLPLCTDNAYAMSFQHVRDTGGPAIFSIDRTLIGGSKKTVEFAVERFLL